MKAELTEFLVFFALLSCRVAACITFLPGIASERLPATGRLFLTLALTLALSAMGSELQTAVRKTGEVLVLTSMLGELFVGAFLGLMVRLFYLALEFAAAAAANYAGYGSVFEQSIESGHMSGPFSELVTLTSLVLFFVMDLHLAVFAMLGASFDGIPVGGLSTSIGLEMFNSALKTSFILTLQLSAPLIVYSIVLNVGLGLLNKLMPQVPIYFISAPVVMAGGLLILFQSNAAMLRMFISGLGDWIGRLPGLG